MTYNNTAMEMEHKANYSKQVMPMELKTNHLFSQAINEQPKKPLKDDQGWIVDRQEDVSKQKPNVHQTLKQMKRQLSRDQYVTGCFLYTDCSFCMHWHHNEDPDAQSECCKCNDCNLQDAISCDYFSDLDLSRYFCCCSFFSELMS